MTEPAVHSMFDDPSKPLATEFMVAIPSRKGLDDRGAAVRVREFLAVTYPHLKFSVGRLPEEICSSHWQVMPMIGAIGGRGDYAAITARPDLDTAASIARTLEGFETSAAARLH